jgi:trehalose 6-phosphate synthase
MTRVVIVSNRVVATKNAVQAGGVAVAIADTLAERDGLWFGWSGAIEDDATSTSVATLVNEPGGPPCAVLPLTNEEYLGYYLGYANSVLWPVFHNRVDLARFEAGFYPVYQAVNRRFAAALAPLLRPDDIVWVHDYHFVPLARALRELGVRNRIGFYLHIPFPPSQAFLTVPEHRQLANALAAYDCIGLQTATDVRHLIDYLEHGARGHLLPDGRMRVDGEVCSIASIPVGIDPHFFREPEDDEATDEPEPLQNASLARLIGVDRLDYTKGLPHKFRGFGRFLEQFPEYRKKVILTQIAAPSRESVEAYADIRQELESLSGSINGAFAEIDWVPIHYINRSIARTRLTKVYRESKVGLITPLRDGMNLVAKEYVAAQTLEDPGVLVLSRFAGAAEELGEAVTINPYNIDEIAGAIRIALEMPLDERRHRQARLLAKIRAHDAHHWSNACIRHIDRTERLCTPAHGIPDRMSRAIDQLR